MSLCEGKLERLRPTHTTQPEGVKGSSPQSLESRAEPEISQSPSVPKHCLAQLEALLWSVPFGTRDGRPYMRHLWYGDIQYALPTNHEDPPALLPVSGLVSPSASLGAVVPLFIISSTFFSNCLNWFLSLLHHPCTCYGEPASNCLCFSLSNAPSF